jgi:hypothetical protein
MPSLETKPAGAKPAVLLDLRSRPQGAQRAFIVGLAAIGGAAGTWLALSLDAAGIGLPLALGIGSGIAVGVVFFAFQGSRIVVTDDGLLTYSLHGRPNLVIELAQITAVKPIERGLVRGLGLELADPQRTRFLHKTGISPERMRRWRDEIAVDVLLEGFGATVGDQLDTLRQMPAQV